jgi:hypothetical protein
VLRWRNFAVLAVLKNTKKKKKKPKPHWGPLGVWELRKPLSFGCIFSPLSAPLTPWAFYFPLGALLLPPPCSQPPLPPPSHCLITSRCLRRQLFPTFADNTTCYPPGSCHLKIRSARGGGFGLEVREAGPGR